MRVVRFTVIVEMNGKRLASPPLPALDAVAWRIDREDEGWNYIATKAEMMEVKP